jgi:hypothetical protein
MKHEVIGRVPNGEDTVLLAGKRHVIRFSAKHAQHIVDNFPDKAHQIRFGQIVALLKDSILLPAPPKKWVALGRFGNKIYETYLFWEKGRLDVITSYVSINPPLIEYYKTYENSRKK